MAAISIQKAMNAVFIFPTRCHLQHANIKINGKYRFTRNLKEDVCLVGKMKD